MARMIRPLANVHEQLRRLPGIGSKTALRLAYHIIDMPEEEVRRLAETLLEAKRQIRLCDICYNLTDAETCEVCGNAGRDHSVVCVVEQPQDVMAMERSRGYNGVYHVLHGVLSPLDGIGPDNLRVKELLRRLQGDTVREVIIATNILFTVHFITQRYLCFKILEIHRTEHNRYNIHHTKELIFHLLLITP